MSPWFTVPRPLSPSQRSKAQPRTHVRERLDCAGPMSHTPPAHPDNESIRTFGGDVLCIVSLESKNQMREASTNSDVRVRPFAHASTGICLDAVVDPPDAQQDVIESWTAGLDGLHTDVSPPPEPGVSPSLEHLAHNLMVHFASHGFNWDTASEQLYETHVMSQLVDIPFWPWHSVAGVQYTRCVAVVHAPRRRRHVLYPVHHFVAIPHRVCQA